MFYHFHVLFFFFKHNSGSTYLCICKRGAIYQLYKLLKNQKTKACFLLNMNVIMAVRLPTNPPDIPTSPPGTNLQPEFAAIIQCRRQHIIFFFWSENFQKGGGANIVAPPWFLPRMAIISSRILGAGGNIGGRWFFILNYLFVAFFAY